ncbi:MAG: hypothetical protein K2K55_07305 [Duncaniella sp.]|nr:hypothetical protein [Duncaniella sp.]
MNKIFSLMAAAVVTLTASAKTTSTFPWPENSFTNPSVERTPTSLVLTMDIHPDAFGEISSNRQAWLRPAVIHQGDTLWLNPVIVAGRTRYYQSLRTGATPENAVMLRAGSTETYPYQAIMPYEPWMDLCDLVLTGTVSACCGNSLGAIKPDQPLASCDFRIKELTPAYIYVSPVEELVKTRAAKGQAFIDYPVGKTVILPDFRSNAAELGKIRSTIDKVKNDPDYTITSIAFRGYASPEGSYALNERLAKGRTESLIGYVRNLYSFPESLMHASWVAEDWEGLADRLQTLDIENRDAILALCVSDKLTPDQKDQRIKADFPTQYAYLLANVYPALRRCDYEIAYNVRNYTDVSEIAAVISSAPQNLSLSEIYAYAQTLDRQSPQFREVMEVAVRMYPSDPVANLNAASTAAMFGDYPRADLYLSRAGQSPEATYIAGVVAARQGDYTAALPLLTTASEAGVAEAGALIAQMRDYNMIP